ncbi:MAG: DNA primase [Treponemataceae bacterium]|nr:DNA primase [Treponemataceae bacterium]
MARFTRSTIDEVNSKCDIVSLIGEYVRLEKRGSEYWGCCPFHNEKTPSFHVVPDRKMYHCFGCGAGGSAISFLMEMEKMSFSETVLSLAKKYGVNVEYEEGAAIPSAPEENKKDMYKDLYTRVAGSFHYLLTSTKEGEFALQYLKSRGVSDEIAEKFLLGFAPADRRWLRRFLKSKNYSDSFLDESGLFSKKYKEISFFSNRLMFPICDKAGKVVAFSGRILEGEGPKYLNSGDLIQYKKGETLFAFNLAKQSIRTNKAVIICEGNMDVIAYHQAGLTWTVAPLGTALTEDQLKILKPFADTVYLSFDNDAAGIKATNKAILMTRKLDFNVRVVTLSGGKDPSEILNEQGKDVLTEHIKNAILDSDFLLSVLSKKYNIGTPEGKARASLDFFQYVDVLPSDIQKESCLEQLCRTYQLKPEAVKADFENRSSVLKNIETTNRQSEKGVANQEKIKLNAEVRAVLAVISNTDYFNLMRNSLTADDFEDATARDLFISLEECYRDDSSEPINILERCEDISLKRIIAETVVSGEFSVNTEQAVKDSIRLIKYNSLCRKRERILNRIRQASSASDTLDTKTTLDTLVAEKMNIDTELKRIKDANE